MNRARQTLATLLVFALATPALAQDAAPLIVIPGLTAQDAAIGDTPPGLVDPQSDAGGRILRPRAREDVASEAREPVLAPLLATLPAGMVGTALRMQGENPVAEFSLFLPGGLPPGSIRIAHRSGIDVLPDRSEMRVFVNDVALAPVEMGNFTEPEAAILALPREVWVPGRNRVRIEINQAHRIYCGPDAAFDLWTDVDLAQSGAIIDQRPLDSGPHDFLAAVARDVALRRPIEIRDPAGLDRHARPVLDEVARRLGNIVGGAPLRYTKIDLWRVADPESAEQELPVDVASTARITLIPSDTTGTTRDIAFRRAGDGAEVLVIRVPRDGRSTDHVAAAMSEMLDTLASTALTAPAPRADTEIFHQAPMAVGEPVPLGAMGMRTARTASHYFRRDQVFTLPRDWLVLTAQKAQLNLDYAFARNLPDKSILLIKVNGETVRLLPLWEGGGELIEQFPIKFNANILSEGPNLLQFEALVPGAPADMACPIGRPTLLEILNTSSLEVPDSPAMRLPDIRQPVARLTAGNLLVDGLDIEDMDVAQRLSLVSSLGKPHPEGTGLRVMRLSELGQIPMGDYTFPLAALRDVLQKSPILRLNAPQPNATIGEVPQNQSVFAQRGASTEVSYAGMFVRSWSDFTGGLDLVRQRIMPDANDEAERWLDGQSGKAILLQLDVSDPGRLWIVLSDDVAFADVAASLAAARKTIGGPNGQMSVLGHDGAWRSWADVRRKPALQEPLTLFNMRFVFGNYASWAPGTFALCLFGISLLSAFVALRLVVITRGDR